MLNKFIERPVLSTVISIIIVVLGIIGLITLPVSQYPDIAPPTIQITTQYSGANAETVMKSVVVPIEEQVNGVENMTYISSKAANDGTAAISVYFKQGANADIAAVNVQNLVAKATPLLPSEVTTVGVSVKKQSSSNIMFFSLISNNPKEYDGEFIQNYANINIIPQIKRISGVASADVFGAKDYSMRIWLDPHKMGSYGLTPTDVTTALRDQNIEAAPGELGQNSNQSFQYTLKYAGKLTTKEQFENIIIRSVDGQILYLRDVARVELGALSYTMDSRVNGKVSVVMAISQTSGSNAQEIIKNVEKVLKSSESSMPPGLHFVNLMNANDFLSASIEKVLHTLLEAFILVFIVVFLFLQDFRSTLIPAIAVPVAIIGTFFFLEVFGFTINLLTLFALVLAIGIVVDDAIVVVEAVHAQLDNGETSAKKATIKAMSEIAPAIISITLVMSAVFIPVSFIGGTTGVFYKQFGLTLAIAIGISAVNALTLSPALCALFLKPHKEEEAHKEGMLTKFFNGFNRVFNAGTSRYKSSLHFLGKKGNRWITGGILIFFVILFVGLMKFCPTDFVPNEDGGIIIGNLALPPSSSLEDNMALAKEVSDSISKIPEIENIAQINGMSFFSGNGSAFTTYILKLIPWNDRPKADINTVIAKINKKLTKFQNPVQTMFIASPTLPGFGIAAGVDVQLQDKTGGDIAKFEKISRAFTDELAKRPEIMMARNTYDSRFKQIEIVPNMANIKKDGLTLMDVMGTLQAYIGSMYISNFNVYGKQFRVMMQADPESRSKLEDLSGISVKTASGKMTPITGYLSTKVVTGPQQLTRFNLFGSMYVMVIPNIPAGKSTGDAMQAIKEVAAKTLPQGYGYDYSGLSREAANSGSQTIFIFGLCILFIYLLLSALYESYILPLAVILSLPIGLSGVFLFTFLIPLVVAPTHMILNNIYVQISMIMLIGLLAKNAILIVEYAVQRRQSGMSIVQSAINGAVARLRPILMTSFAFIFGLLPLMLASGAGAIGNRSIGTAAIGGMLVGTLVGLLVIPTLFILFQSLQEKFSKTGLINEEENAEN